MALKALGETMRLDFGPAHKLYMEARWLQSLGVTWSEGFTGMFRQVQVQNRDYLGDLAGEENGYINVYPDAHIRQTKSSNGCTPNEQNPPNWRVFVSNYVFELFNHHQLDGTE